MKITLTIGETPTGAYKILFGPAGKDGITAAMQAAAQADPKKFVRVAVWRNGFLFRHKTVCDPNLPSQLAIAPQEPKS